MESPRTLGKFTTAGPSRVRLREGRLHGSLVSIINKALEFSTLAVPIDLQKICQALGELSPLPLAAVEGPRHLVCYVNPAFIQIMGQSKDEMIGKPFHEITHLTNDCGALMDRVVRTGESATHTEHELSRPRPAFWSYTLWPAMAGTRTLGIMIQVTETTQFHERMLAMNEALVLGSVRQDELIDAAAAANAQLHEEIIARKQAEEVLHRAQMQLEDRAGQLESAVSERTAELTSINKQLDAFVYTIAHDLRAPLRSMQGFSALLIEDGGSTLSETGRNYANRINLSAQFMDSLLHDLLVFSRVAQERIQLTEVNTEMVVKAALDRLETEIKETNACIELIGPWLPVLAHGPTLGQVLTNLITNALKFVAPGVAPLVRVRMEDQFHFVRVWIEDNGVGIAVDQRERIYQLFTRLHGEKFPGTGIGLAIVEKGIERMGGRMGLESAPGQGCRFWFELKKA
jgi:signal transduction histidine kinase